MVVHSLYHHRCCYNLIDVLCKSSTQRTCCKQLPFTFLVRPCITCNPSFLVWNRCIDRIFFDDTISLVISQNILVLLQRVGYFEYYILTCLNRITNSYYNVLSLLNTSMIRAQNSVLRSTNRNIRLLLYRRNVFIRLSSSNYIHIIFRNEFLLCCKISIYWDDYQRQYDDKHSSWRQYVSQHSLCP